MQTRIWQQAVHCTHHVQYRPDQTYQVLSQVWWCLTSLASSKIFAHDLATAVTSELQSVQGDKGAVVSCMHMDAQGYVWMGFQGGVVQVWDADRRACLCQAVDEEPAAIRWANSLPKTLNPDIAHAYSVISAVN